MLARRDFLIVGASILSADFTQLDREIQSMLDCEVYWIHVDIMDGAFVNNITFGPSVVESIRAKFPKIILDCHLMVQFPQSWINDFAKAGANCITFHYESNTDHAHIINLVQQIKSANLLAGIAINIETPIEAIVPILESTNINTVLIMSVAPGFGGQSFDASVLSKASYIRTVFPNILVQIDGGINNENARSVYDAGVDIAIAGSYIFKAQDRMANIQQLRYASLDDPLSMDNCESFADLPKELRGKLN